MPLLYYIWNIVQEEGHSVSVVGQHMLFHSGGLILSQATRGTILKLPSSIHFSNCVMA